MSKVCCLYVRVSTLEQTGGAESQTRALIDWALKNNIQNYEISFSNSMVEALFRSIKNNYLYSQQIKNPKSLRKHVDFWFGEHNDRIPHTAFKGETPFEKFNQTWNKEQEVRILLRQEDAIKLRIKHNQQVFCQLCKAA